MEAVAQLVPAHSALPARTVPAPLAGARHRFPACPMSPARPPRKPKPAPRPQQ
jgi:hypothetical protein